VGDKPVKIPPPHARNPFNRAVLMIYVGVCGGRLYYLYNIRKKVLLFYAKSIP
jgi:hypothetical protein